MTTINVQFSGATETTIISYFSSPQSSAGILNSGQVTASDARWKTFYDGLPEMSQAGMPVPE